MSFPFSRGLRTTKGFGTPTGLEEGPLFVAEGPIYRVELRPPARQALGKLDASTQEGDAALRDPHRQALVQELRTTGVRGWSRRVIARGCAAAAVGFARLLCHDAGYRRITTCLSLRIARTQAFARARAVVRRSLQRA